MTRTILALALVVLAGVVTPSAGQTVRGERLQLSTGPCTLRSGSGAPSSGLGVVCDTYFRTDSPYTIYVKTGGSTWSEIYRAGGTDVAVADGGTGLSSYTTGQLLYASGSGTLAGLNAVATGQVLASAGTSTAPAYTATPSVTSLTASGGVQGATVTGTTSVSSPLFTHSAASQLTTASGNFTIAPAGDLVFNPTGNDLLPTTGYDLNIGALTNKFLTLHAAELWVETLVAQDTMATIGGRILVGPTTTLTADLASGATSMQVKHNQIASGDRVVLQANGSVEWIAVTSSASGSAGAYVYSITRNLDGSGANDWVAGDAVFNTGTTGDGYIDLYSVSGVLPGSTAGPTVVGNARTGTTYSSVAARWAIGNLNGLYGYGADTYGAAFGDAAAANVTIDATNGIRFRNSTTTTLGITGSTIDLLNTGVIKSGAASALGTGTGIWAAANSGTPQVRVGNPAADYLQWDGSNLSLVSSNLTINSTGVYIAPNTSGSPVGTRAYGFTVSGGGAMYLAGYRDSGDTSRSLSLTNDSNSGSIDAATTISASNGTVDAQMTAVAGSGLNQVSLQAGSTVVTASGTNNAVSLTATAAIEMDAPYTMFDGDFQVFTNNGTTTANPYIRSDGNYLVIESRSSANGGAIYLGLDQATTIVLGAGGGQTWIQTPHFTTNAPRWAAGLTQTTVGAAGAASALPANPVAYIKIADASGNVYVVPAYNR